ncbi:MAG: hypothetical protein NTW21_00485 [Verrucomicrobia bacterium]|nr:hypothetical protein [Verrucomicrobiota bacterium]
MISLREPALLGQRIDSWALDSWQHDQWQEFAVSTGIGARRLWRGQPLTSDKVRLRLTHASASPALSGFGIYLEPPLGAAAHPPATTLLFIGNEAAEILSCL